MKTVRFYVQTAINLQRKCLGTPDCKNMENMLIDFIWLNVQAEYLIQTILYHFKWDIALWRWPKCPQYMQRTWWQTVAYSIRGWRNYSHRIFFFKFACFIQGIQTSLDLVFGRVRGNANPPCKYGWYLSSLWQLMLWRLLVPEHQLTWCWFSNR